MKRLTITVKLNKVHSLASTTEVIAKDYGKDTIEIITNKINNNLKIKTLSAVLSTESEYITIPELIKRLPSIYPIDMEYKRSLYFIDMLKEVHTIDKNLTVDNYRNSKNSKFALTNDWFISVRNDTLYIVHVSINVSENIEFLEDEIATVTEVKGISGKAVFDQLKKAKLLLKPVSLKTIGVILAASTYVLWRSSDDYDKYAEFIESLDLPSTLTTIPETIYRGLSLSKIAINRLKNGKRIKLRPRALTSWDKAKSRPKFVSQQFSKRLSNVENYKYNESREKLLKPLSRGTVLLRLDSNNKNKDDKTECLVNLYEVGKQPEAKSILWDSTYFREIIMRNNGGFKYITREDLV